MWDGYMGFMHVNKALIVDEHAPMLCAGLNPNMTDAVFKLSNTRARYKENSFPCVLVFAFHTRQYNIHRPFFMTPPTPTPSSLSSPVISNESHDQHERLCKTVAPFDLVDIGQRIPDLPSDLHNVKSILVTGGAGFMWVLVAGETPWILMPWCSL